MQVHKNKDVRSERISNYLHLTSKYIRQFPPLHCSRVQERYIRQKRRQIPNAELKIRRVEIISEGAFIHQHRERCQFWSTEIKSKQINNSIIAFQILYDASSLASLCVNESDQICTQPDQTLFLFKSIWMRPQGSQRCQKIRFFITNKTVEFLH